MDQYWRAAQRCGLHARSSKSADPFGVWKSVFFGLRSSASVINIVHSNQSCSMFSMFSIQYCSVFILVQCSLFLVLQSSNFNVNCRLDVSTEQGESEGDKGGPLIKTPYGASVGASAIPLANKHVHRYLCCLASGKCLKSVRKSVQKCH